jgi:hypothetical protein
MGGGVYQRYVEMSDRCRVLATQAPTEHAKVLWLRLAESWLLFANDIANPEKAEGRPNVADFKETAH